jgi:putative transposase
MTSPTAIQPGTYYHIFNRGNNKEDIFVEEKNYHYFLELYTNHISPIAETFAYCLLRNHFHFLVRIKALTELKINNKNSEPQSLLLPSQHFSNYFNAYTKAFNKAYVRVGSLFQHPFGRVRVESNVHLAHLVKYIHYNPQKHGFLGDFREYRYSLYRALISNKPTQLEREITLSWFDGRDGFINSHKSESDFGSIKYLVERSERLA